MPLRDSPRLLSRWDLAALAGLLVLAGLFALVAPRLPDAVPVHFDALGRANGWAPRTQLPWLLFGIPALVWGLLFLVGAVAASLPGDAARAQAAVIFPLRGMMGLGLGLVMAGVLLVPLLGATALWSGLLALAVCMILGIVFMVRDACLATARLPAAEHWRGGMFYVNPQDPRLWVPKRVGVGWTLNFGRPAAVWVCLLLLAAIPALFLAVQFLVRR